MASLSQGQDQEGVATLSQCHQGRTKNAGGELEKYILNDYLPLSNLISGFSK